MREQHPVTPCRGNCTGIVQLCSDCSHNLLGGSYGVSARDWFGSRSRMAALSACIFIAGFGFPRRLAMLHLYGPCWKQGLEEAALVLPSQLDA